MNRQLLISTLRTLERSYICIDALDEFPQEYRRELFTSLAQITQESLGTRLFATVVTREEVGRYFTCKAEIRIILNKEDIKKYLTIRLRNDTQPRVMNDNSREEIFTAIPERISEM